MQKRGFAPIFVILIVAAAAALGGGALYYAKVFKKPAQVACTQEAKLCPDGSYVGRTGPNCEFAECPEPVEGRVVPASAPAQPATGTVAANTSTRQIPNPSINSPHASAVISTSTWKVYKNTKYGFKFMYPEDNAPVIMAGDEGYTFKDGGAALVIKPELIDERISTWLDDNLAKYMSDTAAVSRKDISIEGRAGVEITAAQTAPNNPYVYRLYVIKPGNYFLVITETAPSTLFDAIFSTLSFGSQ